MKLGVLFSGGKDSCFALYLAKKYGHDIRCLISIYSENKESFMFHTPSISSVKEQATVLQIPLIMQKTKGSKELELNDLEKAIKEAKEQYKIEGIVTGAIESAYQSSRIQNICNKFKLDVFNPLWQKDQIELLNDLINNDFNIILTGIFAYPLNKSWLGRRIDKDFIRELNILKEKFKINPAGEGGEFESFVLNCPLFKRELKIIDSKTYGEGNSWRMELKVR
ncbi:MAG: diphthine--ammonia ligase [Nanoarchaeota archaeon]